MDFAAPRMSACGIVSRVIWTFEIWQGDRKLATQAFKVITLSPDDQKLIRPTADAHMSAPTAGCEECNGL